MKQQNVKRRWMTTIFLVAASAAAAVFFTRRYDLCCCLILARTYCVRTFTHKRWSDIALFVYCVCSIRLFLFVYMQYRQTGFLSATNERNSGRDFYCFHTHKTNEMEKMFASHKVFLWRLKKENAHKHSHAHMDDLRSHRRQNAKETKGRVGQRRLRNGAKLTTEIRYATNFLRLWLLDNAGHRNKRSSAIKSPRSTSRE